MLFLIRTLPFLYHAQLGRKKVFSLECLKHIDQFTFDQLETSYVKTKKTKRTHPSVIFL